MANPPTTGTLIHPAARIDPSAQLGEGVAIAPGVIIGPRCVIGERTRIGANAVIVENTTVGADCRVHAGAVLGDEPQDRAFDPAADRGALVIGDGVVIREYATIHRGAGEAGPTRIGSGCFIMVSAHVGHNCRIADGVILTNFAALAGHVRIGERAVLSSHCGVHQYCEIGEYVMLQGGAGVSQHVPPYTVVHRSGTMLAGINVVGLRRSGRFDRADIDQIREVYRLVCRSRTPLDAALHRVQERNWRPAAQRMIDFIADARTRTPPHARGVCAARRSTRMTASEPAP